MFCSNCGMKLQDGQKFCTRCGEKIEVDAPVAAQQEPTQQEPTQQESTQQEPMQQVLQQQVQPQWVPSQQTPTKTNTGKIIGMIAGILVALVLVGGGVTILIQNRSYDHYTSQITEYAIQSYVQQMESYEKKWEDMSFLQFLQKGELLGELKTVYSEAKEADDRLKDYQNRLDSMTDEKEKYDLAMEYAAYEELLAQCKDAVDQRDIKNADTLMEDVEQSYENLLQADKDYVDAKLEAYGTVDWSNADPADKSTYDTEVAKIQDLVDQEDFGTLKATFETLDNICYQYMESENDLDIAIQQVDVSAYPEIKLYLNVTDADTGEVPENLDTTLFFIRKEDANGDYVKQTIKKVNQLNELEALKVDMVADVSASMDGSPIMQAKEVMVNFINSVQFSAGDQVELTSFSTGVQIEEEFCGQADTLTSEIEDLYTDDMTSLYDALYTAVTRVAAQQGAKCVIAFTDGYDNYSQCSSDDVVTLATRYHVPIFIVGFSGADASTMYSIASQTGGRYYDIDDIYNMEEIYKDIYRQEKEMYLVEFTDESGGKMTDEINLLAGYHSAEYGGESYCDFQPNLLISVDGANLYTSGPEATVESYLKGFDDAMSYQDFSYISDYLKKDSNIYKSQKEYVKKGISESLDSYEIVDVDYSGKKKCIVTTRETYYVQRQGEPLELMTQQCQYQLKKTSDGWKMTDFAGPVEVLSRIND